MGALEIFKKYQQSLVFDYTEYPTKAIWSERLGSSDYSSDLLTWLDSDEDKSSVFYVHTPFCEELCYFCLCSKEITRDYDKVHDFLHGPLTTEFLRLEDLLKSSRSRPLFKEIYFGGGSPTYYNEADFIYLKSLVSRIVDLESVETWTVEIDPRRVTEERLIFYSDCGVNRLSFGIQDFDLDVQKEINRVQPPELLTRLLTPDVRKRFPVINFDLLIGLPRQTTESVTNTIDTTLALRPTQLQTMYVHYKPDVRKYMTRMVRNVPMPDFIDRKALFKVAQERLTSGGYERAGFESYALPDDVLTNSISSHKAVYNSLGVQAGKANNFIAVGPSAHSRFGRYYYQNFYERDVYVSRISEGLFPIYRGYRMSEDDMVRRSIINRIRTYFLVNLDDELTSHGFQSTAAEYFSRELLVLEGLEKDGLVVLDGPRVSLTELGQHLSPTVCEVFDTHNQRDIANQNIASIKWY